MSLRFSSRLTACMLGAALAVGSLALPAAQAQTGSALGELAPAGSAIDSRGLPAPWVLTEAERIAADPATPEQAQTLLLAAIGFFRGDGESGVEVPEQGPAFREFYYPSIATGCLSGGDSIGQSIAVPGPADLPLPGHQAGEAAIVYTALGTGPAVADSSNLTLHWINVSTGRLGQTLLQTSDLNPEGPTTLVGIAQTGPGTIFGVITGGVTHSPEAPQRCEFLPMAGSFTV